MSAEALPKTFFDTNVLVYLFDGDSPEKQARARELFKEFGEARRLVVSSQVLSELYVTLTRKLGKVLSESESQDVVEELATVADVVPIDRETVLSSVARSRQRGFSYWDALIVEAALGAGCVQLLSEDMQHGRRIDTLRIENPFRGPTAPSS